MKPCTRVGLDVTWRCNWKCRHCFYRRNPNLHQQVDTPLGEIRDTLCRAKGGGLDHAVLVGYGEPSLAENLDYLLNQAHNLGFATSMITNGATGLRRFKRLFAHGMDHLHLSSHGLDGTFDRIAGTPGAFRKQAELKEWLAAEGLPFRTNVTLQKQNYQDLPELAEYEIEHGVYHFVFLGFLPHYEWQDHLSEVAVDPAELRPYIEDGADRLLETATYFTIRYHPLCHLAPRYWPYVVNARYVAFDPWEWNYSLQATDAEALWKDSVACGESTAIQGEPCSRCAARRHCGGWNRTYAAAFDGAGLTPIEEPPPEYADVWDQDGGLHDLNPANQLTGTIRKTWLCCKKLQNDG
jgi:MoaA/NifB/PqqE/SkfB family radical SAM enzyme